MTVPRRYVPPDRPPSRNEGAASAHPSEASAESKQPSGRWQFGLPALLGTMMLLCLPFAIWGAILRANEDEQLVWMVVCLITPLGVVCVLGVALWLGRFLGSMRRARVAPEDDLPGRQRDQ